MTGRPRLPAIAELAIAGLVLAVVAMLIVPLPRPLVDALLALNLGLSVALLMAALFAHRPLRFAAFAASDGPRLRLLTSSGETRWETTLWSGSAVEWTPAGELLVQFPSGVARIDLDTGALADRRCGWSFGLSEQVQPTRDSGPSICEAERPPG